MRAGKSSAKAASDEQSREEQNPAGMDEVEAQRPRDGAADGAARASKRVRRERSLGPSPDHGIDPADHHARVVVEPQEDDDRMEEGEGAPPSSQSSSAAMSLGSPRPTQTPQGVEVVDLADDEEEAVKAESTQDILAEGAAMAAQFLQQMRQTMAGAQGAAPPAPQARFKEATLSDLDGDQKLALQWAMEGRSFFFTGSAGTGKSTTLKFIIQSLRSRRKTVAVTASTGAAALLIQGCTLHSWAGVGLGLATVDSLIRTISTKPFKKKALQRWQTTDVLVVDEVSMVHGEFLDKLEQLGRALRMNESPFGGIQLILCGDFGQLPPVSRVAVSDSNRFLFQHEVFKDCISDCLLLQKVHRQTDEKFVRMLTQVREARMDDETLDLIESLRHSKLTNAAGIKPTVLFSKNIDVDNLNMAHLKRLKGESVVYNATDMGKEHARAKLDRFSQLPMRLELKIGAQVILLKNLNAPEGLVNGSRGKVVSFGMSGGEMQSDGSMTEQEESIGVQFLTYPGVYYVKRQTDDWHEGKEVVASRIQFPLRLAWAMTIHKSQGMTCDLLQVDLRGCFEVGQAYTALSRARSLHCLRVNGFTKDCVMASPSVVAFYDDMRRWSEERRQSGASAATG